MSTRNGSPPRKAAGGPGVATKTAEPNPYRNHSRGRRQDGYAAPDQADRAEREFLAYAEQFGYRIAVRCIDCGSWLADPVSVAHHRGPVCRRRAGVASCTP